jgi:hypothetical protein
MRHEPARTALALKYKYELISIYIYINMSPVDGLMGPWARRFRACEEEQGERWCLSLAFSSSKDLRQSCRLTATMGIVTHVSATWRGEPAWAIISLFVVEP